MAVWGQYFVSEEGETVDRLVHRVLGRQDGLLVEKTLKINPRLADHGVELPAGVRVLMPGEPEPSTQKVSRLWD
jgi:phage tail protein X